MTDAPVVSEASHAAARDYLRRDRKAPCTTDDGRWRWVLPDVAPSVARRREELPAAIFGRLRSDQERPWLFRSIPDAMRAAHQATAEAIAAGEIHP